MEKMLVDISYKSWIRLFLVIFVIVLTFKLFGVLLLLFVSYILSVSLRPIVDVLVSKGWKLILAVALVYVLFLTVLAISIMFIVIPFINEFSNVASNTILYWEMLLDKYNWVISWLNRYGIVVSFDFSSVNLREVLSNILLSENGLLATGVNLANMILGFILQLVTVLMLSFYITYTYHDILKWVMSLISNKNKKRIIYKSIIEANKRLGAWLRGQAMLSLIIGLGSYIILRIFNVPFAFSFAVLAGLLEVVPNLGPLMSLMLPAVAVLATGNVVQLIGVIVGFILLQQVENYVLVPRIMSKAIEVHPLLILIALLVFGTLLGPLGVIIAIPLLAVTQVILPIIKHLYKLS